MNPEGDGSEGRVESVKGQDGEGDGQQESDEEKDVGDGERLAETPVPAQLWMCCSKHAQGEKQDDDIDDENANVRENLCRNGDVRIFRSSCPHEPEHACADARHAETKHGPRHDKSVTLSSIELIDGHVRDSADQVDEDEDGAYSYVLMVIGMATNTCNAGRDIWRLQSTQSISLTKSS